MKKKYQLRLRV